MNYSWKRADQMSIGVTVYAATDDKGLIWIEQAGDLHLKFYFADRTFRLVRRDAPIMVQVCHRRQYEQSSHHTPINAGNAILRVYRRTYGNKTWREARGLKNNES